jgi:site-specific DNA recombinase
MVAIGYCRRSRESGARTVSLEEQAAQIRRYAEAQGWTLAELVTDDGVSGGKRQRLTRLEAVVRAHRASVVIAYHLDRVARDVAALLDTLRVYSRRGVELHVVGRGRVEADSASGFLVTGVEGLMAEHYRRLIGEKTRDALAHLRARGRAWTRIVPYGFQKTQDGRLVHHQGEQTVLALIASLRRSGASWRALCAELTARGITQRNGQPWSVALLHRIATRQPVELLVDTEAA